MMESRLKGDPEWQENGMKQTGETEQGQLYCLDNGDIAKIQTIHVEARGQLNENEVYQLGIEFMAIVKNVLVCRIQASSDTVLYHHAGLWGALQFQNLMDKLFS